MREEPPVVRKQAIQNNPLNASDKTRQIHLPSFDLQSIHCSAEKDARLVELSVVEEEKKASDEMRVLLSRVALVLEKSESPESLLVRGYEDRRQQLADQIEAQMEEDRLEWDQAFERLMSSRRKRALQCGFPHFGSYLVTELQKDGLKFSTLKDQMSLWAQMIRPIQNEQFRLFELRWGRKPGSLLDLLSPSPEGEPCLILQGEEFQQALLQAAEYVETLLIHPGDMEKDMPLLSEAIRQNNFSLKLSDSLAQRVEQPPISSTHGFHLSLPLSEPFFPLLSVWKALGHCYGEWFQRAYFLNSQRECRDIWGRTLGGICLPLITEKFQEKFYGDNALVRGGWDWNRILYSVSLKGAFFDFESILYTLTEVPSLEQMDDLWVSQLSRWMPNMKGTPLLRRLWMLILASDGQPFTSFVEPLLQLSVLSEHPSQPNTIRQMSSKLKIFLKLDPLISPLERLRAAGFADPFNFLTLQRSQYALCHFLGA